MKNIFLTSAVLFSAALTPVFAQHHAQGHGQVHGHHASSSQQNPYPGMQSRQIKALSEQQIDQLRGGKGMAMAMPAELNGYPGPLHVLELASKLSLSDEQVALTQKLHIEMQEAAKAEGGKVIEAERELGILCFNHSATC